MTRDMTTKEALELVLDQVDYTYGACSPTEMVGAVLSTQVIQLARQAINREKADEAKATTTS